MVDEKHQNLKERKKSHKADEKLRPEQTNKDKDEAENKRTE